MNKNKTYILTIIVILSCQSIFGQNNRLQTSNSIGWYNYFGTIKISEKFGLHTEYQWRRDQLVSNWQQGLLRVGINYNANKNVMFRAGYAWIETYPYGEYSLNSLDRDFTEHRIFQMVQLSHQEGILDFSHRFMLEQRFVGRFSSASQATEDEFPLLNRLRYMMRLQVPLKGNEIKNNTPYAAMYNEIFIGFGKNVNANVFDQNRLGILLGYRFNNNFKIEGGYLNQILQFGRQINNQNVIQNNHGIILNSNFAIDVRQKKN